MGNYREEGEKHYTLKELPPEERPRERLLHKGAEALKDSELLAIIIRDGTRQKTALDLANQLIAEAGGNLRTLASRSSKDLQKVKGIGPARAVQIKAALELAARLDKSELQRGKAFVGSRGVFEHFRPLLRDKPKEYFIAALLDTRNQLKRVAEISKGGLNAAIVKPRDLLQEAVREGASAVIVVHNHPSGDPTPSADDLDLTRRLKDACAITGIRFLDHVIIGDGRYVSLADEGKV